MSYVNMDHAAWVQSSIAAGKKLATKGDKRKAIEESRGWAAAPDELTDFQKRAFTVLGIVGGGIYNAPIAWKTVYWQPNTLIFAWWKGLGTFDFSELTRFVFLCHEARIRGYIGPLAPRYLEIHLSERAATGGISQRHPDLHEALLAWRDEFPADHSLVYRKGAEQAA